MKKLVNTSENLDKRKNLEMFSRILPNLQKTNNLFVVETYPENVFVRLVYLYSKSLLMSSINMRMFA